MNCIIMWWQMSLQVWRMLQKPLCGNQMNLATLTGCIASGTSCFLPPASEGWREVIFSLCVSIHTWGGYLIQPWMWGREGGYLIQPWMGERGGGTWSSLGRGEGGTWSSLGREGRGYLIQPWMGRERGYLIESWTGEGGGGVPVSEKGKIFDTRFGLIHVQNGKKYFCQGTPPPPSKGKIFWHQIWLDTCLDWEKKFFVKGHPPPPPPVKGKFFDTRFGLIHVQTGKKKFFVKGHPPPPPPPPVKGKFFDTRFGLIHVQTGKKKFLSREHPPPPPGIARNCYGHAAGGMPLAFTQEDFLVSFFF